MRQGQRRAVFIGFAQHFFQSLGGLALYACPCTQNIKTLLQGQRQRPGKTAESDTVFGQQDAVPVNEQRGNGGVTALAGGLLIVFTKCGDHGVGSLGHGDGSENNLIIKFCFLACRLYRGCNDSEANLMATVDFIRNIGLDVVNLLPFHRLGESKHRQLGRTFDMADQPSPADATMQRLKELVQSRGVLCFVGWETPF